MENTQKYPGSVSAAIKLLLILLAASISIGMFLFLIERILVLFFVPFEDSGIQNLEVGYVTLVSQVFSYSIALFYLNRNYKTAWSDIFRFRAFPLYILLPMIPVIPGGLIILSETNNIITFLVPVPEYFSQSLSEMANDGIYSVISIIIIAPLTEEIIFRGIILEGFLSRYSSVKAVIWSSIIFAVFHLNPLQFVTAFAVGVFLGYIYFKTRSLIPCILAHAFYNSLVYGANLVSRTEPAKDTLNSGPEFQPLWFDMIGLILIITGLLFLTRYFKRKAAASDEIIDLTMRISL